VEKMGERLSLKLVGKLCLEGFGEGQNRSKKDGADRRSISSKEREEKGGKKKRTGRRLLAAKMG